MPYVLSYPTCLVPYVLSCSTCLVLNVLSCLTRLVPYVLSCLVPYMFPCLTCLVPYVPRAKRAPVSHESYVLLYLTCLVPCVFTGCLAPNSTCSFAPRPSFASGVSSLTCIYTSHVLQLWCLVPLVLLLISYLSFLQSGLRLIIVIDGSNDTPNLTISVHYIHYE